MQLSLSLLAIAAIAGLQAGEFPRSLEANHASKPQLDGVLNPPDLSLRGWTRHDADRWLSEEDPKALDLSPQGFPWLGDHMELLINSAEDWSENETAGRGSCWQMVCNLTKSRKGGIGSGGLITGEPHKNFKRLEHVSAMDSIGCAGVPDAAQK